MHNFKDQLCLLYHTAPSRYISVGMETNARAFSRVQAFPLMGKSGKNNPFLKRKTSVNISDVKNSSDTFTPMSIHLLPVNWIEKNVKVAPGIRTGNQVTKV